MDESGRIKRATISIRTSEGNKERLTRAAEEASRSLNQEVEFRLELSLIREAEAGSPSALTLADLVRLVATRIEAQTGRPWNTDAETWRRLSTAVGQVLHLNRPEGAVDRQEAEIVRKLRELRPDQIDYNNPEENKEAVRKIVHVINTSGSVKKQLDEADERARDSAIAAIAPLLNLFQLRSAPEGEDNCTLTAEDAG